MHMFSIAINWDSLFSCDCSHLWMERRSTNLLSSIFSLNAYHKSYANAIHAPNVDQNEVRLTQADTFNSDNNNHDNEHQSVIPPHAHCLPGRPREEFEVELRVCQKQCSRCIGYGHTLTTCDAPI